MTYENLQLNPERYIGYIGPSTRRICPKFKQSGAFSLSAKRGNLPVLRLWGLMTGISHGLNCLVELDGFHMDMDGCVKRFQELFAQAKYKEAAELAAETPQDILPTPNAVAKLQLFIHH